MRLCVQLMLIIHVLQSVPTSLLSNPSCLASLKTLLYSQHQTKRSPNINYSKSSNPKLSRSQSAWCPSSTASPLSILDLSGDGIRDAFSYNWCNPPTLEYIVQWLWDRFEQLISCYTRPLATPAPSQGWNLLFWCTRTRRSARPSNSSGRPIRLIPPHESLGADF